MSERIEDRHEPRSTGGPGNRKDVYMNPQTRRHGDVASEVGRHVHDDTTD